eukprot:1501631-Prymnesium_polylepis.2
MSSELWPSAASRLKIERRRGCERRTAQEREMCASPSVHACLVSKQALHACAALSGGRQQSSAATAVRSRQALRHVGAVHAVDALGLLRLGAGAPADPKVHPSFRWLLAHRLKARHPGDRRLGHTRRRRAALAAAAVAALAVAALAVRGAEAGSARGHVAAERGERVLARDRRAPTRVRQRGCTRRVGDLPALSARRREHARLAVRRPRAAGGSFDGRRPSAGAVLGAHDSPGLERGCAAPSERSTRRLGGSTAHTQQLACTPALPAVAAPLRHHKRRAGRAGRALLDDFHATLELGTAGAALHVPADRVTRYGRWPMMSPGAVSGRYARPA